MTTLRTLGATLFLLLAVQGCSASGARPNRPEPQGTPTHLTVDNQTFSTIDIYIVYQDQAYRVDQVFGGQKVTLDMPRFVEPTGSIRALVDPIGSFAAYLSDPTSYLGNEDFTLTVKEPLELSTFVPFNK